MFSPCAAWKTNLYGRTDLYYHRTTYTTTTTPAKRDDYVVIQNRKYTKHLEEPWGFSSFSTAVSNLAVTHIAHYGQLLR